MCIKSFPKCLTPRQKDSQNPAALFIDSLKLQLRGKLLFEPPTPGVVVYENGVAFQPFRKAIVSENMVQNRFPVLVKIRFKFRNLPFWMNRLLSWIPVPLITAQPGFISKTWYQKPETSDFMGIYEFNSVHNATAYWHSLPVRLMEKRAVPTSLQAEIITFRPNQCRVDFGKQTKRPLIR